jgi:hypothetical protein
MTTDELTQCINDYQSGSDRVKQSAAFETLFARVQPIARLKMRRFPCLADVDDLTQEARLTLMKAIKEYDPTRHPSKNYDGFVGYFSMIYYSRLMNVLTIANADMRRINRIAVSLDGDVGDVVTCKRIDPNDDLMEAKRLRKVAKVVKPYLSAIEYLCFVLTALHGETYARVVEYLNKHKVRGNKKVTLKTVDNACQRAAVKIRNQYKYIAPQLDLPTDLQNISR